MANATLAKRGGLSRRSIMRGFGAIAAANSMAQHAGASEAQMPEDPVASWNEVPTKAAILNFVRATTDPSSKTFVAPEDRIATFDQDGTLWVEHPVYNQAIFALDRVHALAPQHPEWQALEHLKAVLSNDRAAMARFTEGDWAEIIFLTHAGMSQTAFLEIAGQWLATAKDARFRRLYTELVYQPTLEVTHLLRANGFKTYIVSGLDQSFVRIYAQRVYGIPTEQVVGSSLVTKYEIENGKAELMRQPKLSLYQLD